MKTVYIGFGSNLGNRLENIKTAISYLSNEKDVEIVNISSVYESEPMYNMDQNDYFNVVAEIKTEVTPTQLLKVLKDIEKKMGRGFDVPKNSSRIIDLDIEFFDDIELDLNNLVIPHPLLYERLFVLEPLNELNKNFVCCKTGKSVKLLLVECTDNSNIRKVANISM